MSYKQIKTTYEVWKSIKQAHPCLVVFSSYSAPERGIMETSYCFKGADYPIIEARTTWDAVPLWDVMEETKNEQHEYWLCVGVSPTDEF
jgi:hypothetical protein